MSMLKKGNQKLGEGIYTFSLTAVASCPGATDYCASRCYADNVQRRYRTAREAWEANFELAADDLGGFETLLKLDMSRLKSGSVVRIHVSGDFFSAAYVRVWQRTMMTRPDVRFYAYTRSWRIPHIWEELAGIEAKTPNFRLWLSTDLESGPIPQGYREASMLAKGLETRAGFVTCPEQTGKLPSCTACTLCYHDNVKPNARLAFVEH
jgi:hypothetical protein